MLPVHPDALRIALFYAAFFAITGLYAPFWPVFLSDRGLGPEDIGLLFGIGLIVRSLTAPLFGFTADRYLGLRRTMALLAGGAFAVFLTFGLARSFVALLTLTVLLMACWPAMLPLAEALTLRHQRAGHLSYGRVRLWGSVGFIGVNLAGGLVLGQFGSWGIWASAAAISAMVWMATLGLRPAPIPAGERSDRPYLRDLLKTLSRPALIVGLLAAGLADASHAAYYAFATINWRAQGISPSVIGLLWASGVVAEVALLWFAGRWLRRRSGLVFIAVGGAAGLVRWTAMAFGPPLWLVVILQNLHALTFGATLLGVMTFISRSVPDRYAGSVQGLYSAMAAGLFMSAASIVSGWLFAHHGSLAYLAMAAMGGTGAALAAALLLRRPVLADGAELEAPGPFVDRQTPVRGRN